MTQIAIVVYPQFTALDFVGPYEVLRGLPDAEVRFVWHEPGPITADSGVLVVGATHSLSETPHPDIVLVPGGPGFAQAARDERLLRWLREAHTTATWTTSVCTGSIVLAAAGLLEGKRATTHWSSLAGLSLYGVTAVSDERIVRADDDSSTSPLPVCPRASTWPCGWSVRWPATTERERSSCSSSTTRSRPTTRAIAARHRRRRWLAPPHCCPGTRSTPRSSVRRRHSPGRARCAGFAPVDEFCRAAMVVSSP